MIRDTPAALSYWQRREQARLHVCAVIWHSITARAADLAGLPARARDASLDAAAHERHVIALSTNL